MTLKWIAVGLATLTAITFAMLARASSRSTVDVGPPMDPTAARNLTSDWTDDDFRTVAAMSRRLRMSPADLGLMMASESGLKPDSAARNSSGYPVAVGLNQLTTVANGCVGITEGERLELLTKSVSEQLPLVERYFACLPWTKAGKTYDHAGVVYSGDAAGYRTASSLDAVLYRESDHDGYGGNTLFDVQKKGYITVGDLVEHMRTSVVGKPVYRAWLQRLREVTGDSSLVPNLPSM